MAPTMLEALYNVSTTRIIVTPTTLPATSFSGDITWGVNNIKHANIAQMKVFAECYSLHSEIQWTFFEIRGV